ncbi:hypothetical protein HELRODRAFT_168811 [Helobdella robusta]|uniref:Death domain-containing protein n=1 Tax=Helobdella robusta TaxID=6412 RepID=T1F101_HELRO|nr:hypothetical protein HELRODRAFT_168811 [Helobdella robusta]ESO08892.1 hypothetical protein HELRODRAFT_168811 [Helobdella robusta]
MAEEGHKDVVMYFRKTILNDLDCSYILTHLIKEIEEEQFNLMLSQNGKKLNEMFYKWLLNNVDGRIYQIILDALKSNGSVKMYKQLNFDDLNINDKEIFREIIFKRIKHLRRIDYKKLVTKLHEKDVINHKENWFLELVKCLKEMKELEALNALSPLLLSSNSEESLLIAIQNFDYQEEDLKDHLPS